MKTALTMLGNQDPIKLAIGAVLVIGAVYYLTRKTVSDVAEGAASVVSGNNAITQNQTNASGEATNAYEGKGIVGTVGAAFNSASGGTLASVGETVGGWIYDWTHLDDPQ
jgi:hypothetical protein